MKLIHGFSGLLIVAIALSGLSSCKTIAFSDLSAGKRLESNLPALTPIVDFASLESAYTAGTSQSVGVGNSFKVFGSYMTTVGLTSTHYKDKRVMDAINIFDNEVKESITDPFGENKGFIALKVSGSEIKYGGAGWIILHTMNFFVFTPILGVPFGSKKTKLEVVVEIFDKEKNLISRYKAVGSGKATMALYYGFPPNEVDRMSNIRALKDAFQKVKDEISSDSEKIIKKLG